MNNVTIFSQPMSNDATAVVLTPAILSAVRKANVEPLPYLFICALIANAASFVLPISNPANLVVFDNAMPPLGKWLLSFGVPSVLSIGATYAVMLALSEGTLFHHRMRSLGHPDENDISLFSVLRPRKTALRV